MLNEALASCRAAHERFRAGMADARSIQQGILRRILAANQATAFGREHGFDQVRDFESFRSRVPIRRFDDFRPYIQRILTGEAAVLSASAPFKFISSSGSTGATKVIPLTREYFTEAFNPFFASYVHCVVQSFPNFLANSAHTLNFKWDPLHAKPKLSNGAEHLGLSQLHLSSEFDDRSLLEPGTNAPWSDVPEAIASELDRIYYRLRIASEQEVRQVIGINPAIIAAVPDILTEYAERLALELEMGTLFGQPFTQPNPARAAHVRAVLQKTGRLEPRDLWPNIECILCWDEGLAGVYIERVAAAYGARVRVVPAPLGASECPVALPLVQEGVRGVLAYNAVFYEFLDVDSDDSRTRLFDELQVGHRYAVIVTQQAGFCRYLLGDVVAVTGTFQGVPTLAYVGRYASDSKLQDCDLLQAVQAQKQAFDIKNFSFGRESSGELDLDVEFFSPKAEPQVADFAARLQNYFAEHLSGQTLRRVQQVDAGTFFNRWKTRVQAGARPAQVKDRILVAAAGGKL